MKGWVPSFWSPPVVQPVAAVWLFLPLVVRLGLSREPILFEVERACQIPCNRGPQLSSGPRAEWWLYFTADLVASVSRGRSTWPYYQWHQAGPKAYPAANGYLVRGCHIAKIFFWLLPDLDCSLWDQGDSELVLVDLTITTVERLEYLNVLTLLEGSGVLLCHLHSCETQAEIIWCKQSKNVSWAPGQISPCAQGAAPLPSSLEVCTGQLCSVGQMDIVPTASCTRALLTCVDSWCHFALLLWLRQSLFLV